MNILFLSIVCFTMLASTSSYGMELPNKDVTEKSTRIWSWPVATALTTIIVGTHQATIQPTIKKAKDSSEDLDWEKIKADETAPTRTSSPINDALILSTPRCTSLNSLASLEMLTLENPNPSENPSKKLTTLETYAADHNFPPVTRHDIDWVKENIHDTKRLNNSNTSLDSTSPSEQTDDSNSHHTKSEVIAFLRENRMKASQPESSPIELCQSPLSSPISSPTSSTCNKNLLSWIARTFTSTMKQIDTFVDDMATTIEDVQEHSLDSIKE